MSIGILSSGLSALNAAQTGLLTTGHNISNAATPGFHRQEMVQQARTAQLTGAGFIGQGVDVSTVKRVYDDFLTRQVTQAQAQAGALDAYYAQIKQLDDMLGDTGSGLAPALQSFFSALDDVAANPGAVPSRQALLSAGEALATRFQTLDQRFADIRTGVNSEISTSVSHINSISQQIARLNESIVIAQNQASGQPANDLLDQRDQLVSELNKEIGATVVKQSDGSYNVFLGTGQPVVIGAKALSLTAINAADDPGRTTVAVVTETGIAAMPESSLQGGALGGYVAFRREALDPGQNTLGRLAVGIAQTFNDQHRLGQDLHGALGADFFDVPTPTVIAKGTNNPASSISASITDAGALTASDYRFTYDGVNYTITRLSDGATSSTATAPGALTPFTVDGVSVTAATLNAGESFLIEPTRNGGRDIALAIADTADIAAAAPIRTAAALANTGTATISAGTVNAPLNANLRHNVTITFQSPTQLRIDDAATGASVIQAYTAGADIQFNGWTVQITGTAVAGDSFSIRPNDNASGDNRNALLLAQLRAARPLLNGTASYLSAYGQVVSDIGNKTRELQVTSEAQNALVAQTQESQQALSGVNLDEEASNLLRYQQAYQAAGRIVQIAGKLFDTLLDVAR